MEHPSPGLEFWRGLLGSGCVSLVAVVKTEALTLLARLLRESSGSPQYPAVTKEGSHE